MCPLPVSFRHLQRMTDDTGLLEHSLGIIPRRNEGYTTDDNARALWACAEWLRHRSEADGRGPEGGRGSADRYPPAGNHTPAGGTGVGPVREELLRLADCYLSFLLWAQREDGNFHNNFAYDRSPEPEQPSDDCLGRTLWACAVAWTRLDDPERRLVAERIFFRAIPRSESMAFPRGWAYALAACCILSEHFPELRRYVDLFEARLLKLYRKNADARWRWFEPVMTYGNGVLPWSLFHAYSVTGCRETLETAKASLGFLIGKMTAPQGWIRPIGNRGWCGRDWRSDWDQQPLEVMKLALAAAQAYTVLKDPVYRETAEKCRAWFHGDNDCRAPLANPEEGSCCDGLTPTGPNRNRGAESTLSYLLTEAVCLNLQMEADANVCCG